MFPGSSGKGHRGSSVVSRWLPKKKLRATLLIGVILGTAFVLYQIFSVKQLGDEMTAEFNLRRSHNRFMGDKIVDTDNILQAPPIDSFREVEAAKSRNTVVRGVKATDLHLYHLKNGKFTCTSSGVDIDFAMVNDDYCDCPEDGSDEPGTNACDKGKFACQVYRSQFPSVIPSSRVNDGICDCCDGSDEWAAIKLKHRLPDAVQVKVNVFQSPCLYHC